MGQIHGGEPENDCLNMYASERLSPVEKKRRKIRTILQLTCATAHKPIMGKSDDHKFYHIYSYIRKLYTSMLISQIFLKDS